ncbi:MAG: DUF3108 domain-containing protein [Pyrinomonadaceae bacterium]
MRKSYIFIFLILAVGTFRFGELRSSFRANAQTEPAGVYRVGERITYNISLDKFKNVAYAETEVVSRGKFNGKDAFEIHSKLKTLNFVTVDFLLVDTARTVFVSPVDGSPIYVKDLDYSSGAPLESVTNFSDTAAGSFDLSSILFKIRASGPSGAFQIYEGGKQYGVTYNMIGTETVKTDAGDFPTNIIDVQSNFLTEHGIANLKINLSNEESAIPVQFRAKTSKGEFRASAASIQIAVPEATPTETPLPLKTPLPTPKPTPAAPVYIENQPLTDKPFDLGETLEYSVTTGGRNVGTVVLTAKERKLVLGKDSLILSATATNAVATDLFRIGNGIRSNVDPNLLSPYDSEVRFDGPLAGFNQSVKFDTDSGKAVVNGASIDIPVGTHNILSLIYAMRQFNLSPSRNSTNPTNDTRVAVFWLGQANVFVLRPAVPQVITIGERKISAQQISIATGNPQLDALSLKVWLSDDIRRIPVRFAIGAYQLDLKITDPGLRP